MNKEPHYMCKACPYVEYRPGGYSVAALHYRDNHPKHRFDVHIEMRYPRREFL